MTETNLRIASDYHREGFVAGALGSNQQQQLDAVDAALPEWKYTGRGRIETIRGLRAALALVEPLVEAINNYLAGAKPRWEAWRNLEIALAAYRAALGSLAESS